MYEHDNQQGEVYIIKEMYGEREMIVGNNPEIMAGVLIKRANLTQLDILKFSDNSKEHGFFNSLLRKKTLENK